MSVHLSKSKYCSAVQCPKMLWLSRNMPEELDDSVFNEAVLETGNEVGDLAMGLFGAYNGHILCPNTHSVKCWILRPFCARSRRKSSLKPWMS